jgi:hypothetical protein
LRCCGERCGDATRAAHHFKCREFDGSRELKLGRWSRHVEGDKRLAMNEFLMFALVPIAVGAVAVVLLLGLHNMARGGSPHRSQKLMRVRVLLQFIAIVVIMLTLWAIGK